MKLKTFMMAIVVFGMTTVGLWGVAGNMATNYGVTISEDLNQLSQVTEIHDQAEDMESTFENPWANIPGIGDIYTIGAAGFQALQSLLDIVDVTMTLIFTINGLIPMPDFVLGGLKAVFMVFFMFTFVGALLNRDV